MANKKRITRKAVESALKAEDYSSASKLGAAAVPHLKSIAADDDQLMAAKAAYLAGVIDVAESYDVIEVAAKSRKPAVRAAAAAAAGKLTAVDPSPILKRLLNSRNTDVRRWALKSMPSTSVEPLESTIMDIRDSDPHAQCRSMARKLLS